MSILQQNQNENVKHKFHLPASFTCSIQFVFLRFFWQISTLLGNSVVTSLRKINGTRNFRKFLVSNFKKIFSECLAKKCFHLCLRCFSMFHFFATVNSFQGSYKLLPSCSWLYFFPQNALKNKGDITLASFFWWALLFSNPDC